MGKQVHKVDYPEDIFDKVIVVNVKGTWLVNKYVLPNTNDGGSIMITSSVAGTAGKHPHLFLISHLLD
ncbi:SDR family oxidoreductase [Dyadobacter sp. UP-52]|uniref:SDR family oxidoreductase n=1 Tax=Dyadobacter subterraneus TaxID=2773304 RepID=A0ABR9WER5_9BACT|nr:SDR family oxidoreductase [Dyadobacter subterraneus]MBE9463988.1 SDR family oxidoreductase [Dyadobacter subterraneus]